MVDSWLVAGFSPGGGPSGENPTQEVFNHGSKQDGQLPANVVAKAMTWETIKHRLMMRGLSSTFNAAFFMVDSWFSK